LLAHRHDLRFYAVDARAHAHAARSRGQAMRRLNSLAPDERFGSPPEILVQDFLDYAREQFELVLEDLRAYPDSPPIVAEGPQLLPELVGAEAACLFATPGFQRELLRRRQPNRRPQIVERDALLVRAIREQATELGRTVIDVDGSLGPDALVARLEARFAHVLAAPRPLPDLRAMRREENDAVCANLTSARIPSFPFACECGRGGCTERVELTTAEFSSTEWVVAPAHAS
jgi:hypothetical protein